MAGEARDKLWDSGILGLCLRPAAAQFPAVITQRVAVITALSFPRSLALTGHFHIMTSLEGNITNPFDRQGNGSSETARGLPRVSQRATGRAWGRVRRLGVGPSAWQSHPGQGACLIPTCRGLVSGISRHILCRAGPNRHRAAPTWIWLWDRDVASRAGDRNSPQFSPENH